MDERLRKIANHYGKESQQLKLIEEMAELTQAIIKGDRSHIIEEMADVELVLQQVKYLMGVQPQLLKLWKEHKINRQLARIERENRNNA